jgi:hypothetical protein
MSRTNIYMPEMPDKVIAADGVPDPKASALESYRYLEARRQTINDSMRQRPLLRLWDKDMKYIGQIAQEKSVQVEEVMSDSGGASVVVRRDNWLSDTILYDRRSVEDLHLTLDPNPTAPHWKTRWGGKITAVNAKRGADGLHTVELEAVSNREHLKHILCAATPFSPPEFQPLKMWMLPWNCRTALTISLWINLCRQYEPFLSIPTNILNPMSWLTTRVGDISPLNWPVQPQYINPLTDGSRTEIFTSRWSDFHTSSSDMLDDAGCIWKAYTWLEEDEESPHPELANIGTDIPAWLGGNIIHGIAERMTRPSRNCVILAVEDKSGITGPTGTLIDGPINLIASTADDLITDTLIPEYDVNGDGQTDPLIAKWFGVAPAPPWVVFRDGDYSAIVESQRSIHGSTARSIVVGGHSPGWLNELQTFGIKYGLSQIQTAMADGQFHVEGPAPVGSGLEECYQGQLDDIAFSYQRYTDPLRALQAGDYAFLELFAQGSGGSAYTVSGELDIRSGQWKSRPFTAFKVSVRNGFPWVAQLDFTLGDRCAFEMANILHVDQVSAIRYLWDKDSPVRVELAIGTKSQEDDPVGKAVRSLAGFWNMFGAFAGSQSLF